jgi:hypothetical protein
MREPAFGVKLDFAAEKPGVLRLAAAVACQKSNYGKQEVNVGIAGS